MVTPKIELNDGQLIPAIGFGTGTAWFKQTGPDGVSPPLVAALKTALRTGYEHLDSAELYGNEKSTGAALSQSGVPRDSFFLTTKVLKGVANLRAALQSQLKDLQVSYVNMYLLHSPLFAERPGSLSLSEAWRGMESLKEEGLTKSIGVSNYRIKDLEATLQEARVKPAINQIEFHPYVWQEAEPLLEYMNKHDIRLAAYGGLAPLARDAGGPLIPVLDSIAAARSLNQNQVLIKWIQAKGGAVITTSGKEWRMKEQLDAAASHTALTADEVKQIDEAGKAGGVKRYFMQHMSG